MVKLTVALLAVALAGAASAAGWRSLLIDASSDAAFEQSLAVFKDKLSPIRQHIFGEALKDIWLKGSLEAEAAEGEFTAADYYRHLDGLRYEQVVAYADPTDIEIARCTPTVMRYREGRKLAYAARANRSFPPSAEPNWGTRPAGGWGVSAASLAQQQQQTGSMSPNGPQGN